MKHNKLNNWVVFVLTIAFLPTLFAFKIGPDVKCFRQYRSDMESVERHYLAGVERCAAAMFEETCLIEVDNDYEDGAEEALDKYARC